MWKHGDDEFGILPLFRAGSNAPCEIPTGFTGDQAFSKAGMVDGGIAAGYTQTRYVMTPFRFFHSMRVRILLFTFLSPAL